MPNTLHRLLWAAIYYTPFFVCCSIIFALSSMSDPPIPHAFQFSDGDKLLHVIAYMITGGAAAFGAFMCKTSFLEAWILTALYGLFDEIHQIFTLLRTPDILDWLADVTGAAIGIVLFFFVSKYVYS